MAALTKRKNKYITPKIQKKLNIIRDVILETVPVKKIYLFGSYAYGKPNKESDLDIYTIVSDNNTEKEIDIYEDKINLKLFDLGILPVDILFDNESNFLFNKNEKYLEENVYNKGIILYEST